MTISYTALVKNARLDAITTQIGTSGLIRIYDGTPPANADASLSSNTLLAELACSSAFAAAASGGVLTANSITADSSANATGTASFFRVLTSGATVKIQGTVGAGSGDLSLNTVSIVASAQVSITSFVLTSGN